MFNNIYKNKKVLITGHTGFKGSWLSMWLIKLGAHVIGVSKDIPTNPSMFEELDLDTDKYNFDFLAESLGFVDRTKIVKMHHIDLGPLYPSYRVGFETELQRVRSELEKVGNFYFTGINNNNKITRINTWGIIRFMFTP